MDNKQKILNGINLLFKAFSFNDAEVAKTYAVVLADENPDFVFNNCIRLAKTWTPKFGLKIPSIKEILENHKNNTDNLEIAEKWLEFKSRCNARYEYIPDWIYTIKRLLGFERVENMTIDDEKYLKLDFQRLYAELKANRIELFSNPTEKFKKLKAPEQKRLPSKNIQVKNNSTQTINPHDYFDKIKEDIKNGSLFNKR